MVCYTKRSQSPSIHFINSISIHHISPITYCSSFFLFLSLCLYISYYLISYYHIIRQFNTVRLTPIPLEPLFNTLILPFTFTFTFIFAVISSHQSHNHQFTMPHKVNDSNSTLASRSSGDQATTEVRNLSMSRTPAPDLQSLN